MTIYIGVLVLTLAILILRRMRNDPLGKYPGPSLAAWTHLWRVWDTVTGLHAIPSLIKLHRKYGDIVRVGPNSLSFSHPRAIKDIYGTDKAFPKSEFYYVAAASAKGQVAPTLFSSTNVAWHDNLRRAVQPAFNLSALVQYEQLVERTVDELTTKLRTRSEENCPVELHTYLHWFAFDVVGELTYGSSFGFLRTESDVDDMISVTRKYLNYTMCVGYMPLLDKLWLKNPLLLWLNRNGLFNARPNPAVGWALKHQASQMSRQSSHEKEDPPGRTTTEPLMEKFMQAKEKNPNVISDKEVLGMGLSMVFAGSETTAITLTAFFYFILKNPNVYRTLRKEVDGAFAMSPATTTVHFKDSFQLPYLDACIKETFRLHPAARFSLERILPLEGATIAGEYVTGGTTVSMNAWALHQRVDVFGEDIDVFRPERWLLADRSRSEETSRSMLHFGAGKFGCIGKNISLLEIYKVIPTLMLEFDFAWFDEAAENERKFEAGSFVNVSLPAVRVRRRHGVAG